MIVLFWILISTFFVSLISFVGVLILLLKERLLNKIILFLVAFSAGALLGSAFLHLLPEAIEQLGVEEEALFKVFFFLILGFCAFFILENYIHWHHHHSKEHPEIMPFSYLILAADAIHNFIDGLLIAASFMTSFSIGLITTLTVILHEIPQEIGDFGILIYGGFKKTKALFLNFLSALWAILGGLSGYFIFNSLGASTLFLLPFAAGGFIYIASSDLIPEIKSRGGSERTGLSFLVFLSGIILMILLRFVGG